MFIRQFSLRLLLAITTVCAGVSLLLSFAWRGHFWAVSLSVFLLVPVAILIVHGVVFWLVWLFSIAASHRQRRLTVGAGVRELKPSGSGNVADVIEASIVPD